MRVSHVPLLARSRSRGAAGERSPHWAEAVILFQLPKSSAEAAARANALCEDAKLLLLGATINAASIFHLAEQRLRVPYRYLKDFTGEYQENGHVSERTWGLSDGTARERKCRNFGQRYLLTEPNLSGRTGSRQLGWRRAA